MPPGQKQEAKQIKQSCVRFKLESSQGPQQENVGNWTKQIIIQIIIVLQINYL